MRLRTGSNCARDGWDSKTMMVKFHIEKMQVYRFGSVPRFRAVRGWMKGHIERVINEVLLHTTMSCRFPCPSNNVSDCEREAE
jgi:hypothetical protein